MKRDAVFLSNLFLYMWSTHAFHGDFKLGPLYYLVFTMYYYYYMLLLFTVYYSVFSIYVFINLPLPFLFQSNPFWFISMASRDGIIS